MTCKIRVTCLTRLGAIKPCGIKKNLERCLMWTVSLQTEKNLKNALLDQISILLTQQFTTYLKQLDRFGSKTSVFQILIRFLQVKERKLRLMHTNSRKHIKKKSMEFTLGKLDNLCMVELMISNIIPCRYRAQISTT